MKKLILAALAALLVFFALPARSLAAEVYTPLDKLELEVYRFGSLHDACNSSIFTDNDKAYSQTGLTTTYGAIIKSISHKWYLEGNDVSLTYDLLDPTKEYTAKVTVFMEPDLTTAGYSFRSGSDSTTPVTTVTVASDVTTNSSAVTNVQVGNDGTYEWISFEWTGKPIAEYPIRINNSDYINANNASDLLNDGGSMSFNNTTNTLTLNNASIPLRTGTHWLPGIYYDGEDPLTIEVIGTCNAVYAKAPSLVTSGGPFMAAYIDYGIASFSGDLIFTGSGTLNISDYPSGGIYSSGDVTFNNAKVNITAVDANAIMGRTIKFSGSSVVNCKSSYGVEAYDEIIFDLNSTGAKITSTFPDGKSMDSQYGAFAALSPDTIVLNANNTITTPAAGKVFQDINYNQFIANADDTAASTAVVEYTGIPTTGDPSRLALLSCLALMAGAALLFLRKRA